VRGAQAEAEEDAGGGGIARKRAAFQGRPLANQSATTPQVSSGAHRGVPVPDQRAWQAQAAAHSGEARKAVENNAPILAPFEPAAPFKG